MKYFLFFIEIIYAQSCPASGEMIWKTGKRITQELSSPASAKLRVIVPVKQNGYPSDWDFRDASSPNFHKHYVGWIMWSRKECGIDFLEAWDDGRLQFDILDAYRNAYSTAGKYVYYMNKPNDKPRSAVAIQFRTKETLATTYKTWNNKPAIEEGAIGQDIFYLIVTALDRVDFLTKNRQSCLESGVVGNMRMDVDGSGNPVGYQDWTQCATADQSIGW